MMNKKISTLIAVGGLFFVLLGTMLFFGFKTDKQFLSVKTENNSAMHLSPKIEPPRLSFFPQGNNPTLGVDSAKVKMIVLIDYQCAYCEHFAQQQLPELIKDYVDKGELQITFRDYPLSFHKNADKLAEAAHLMYAKNNFDVFLKKVWDINPTANIEEIDTALGLDPTSSTTTDLIKDSMNESRYLAGVAGITATPTFIINNRMLVGLKEITELKSLIDYSMKPKERNANQTDGACGK